MRSVADRHGESQQPFFGISFYQALLDERCNEFEFLGEFRQLKHSDVRR